MFIISVVIKYNSWTVKFQHKDLIRERVHLIHYQLKYVFKKNICNDYSC